MAKVTDELLDHEYDGIREYDNPLPGWWLWLFYGTILFSVVYIPYYFFGFGLSEAEVYEAEIAEAKAQYPLWAQAKAAVTMAPADGGAAAAGSPGQATPAAPGVPSLEGDAEAIAAGSALFAINCVACHGPQGQGGIGPNLTDNYWMHGNTWNDLVRTISNGVPDKGMIAWKALFNPTKIAQSAAFVMTLQGTNPPNPKEPQGTEVPAN